MRHYGGHQSHESFRGLFTGARKTAQGPILCTGRLENALEEHRAVDSEPGTPEIHPLPYSVH